MQSRIDTMRVKPDAYQAMTTLPAYVDGTGSEQSLRELMNIHASQINGRAFCLHMHLRDTRRAGELLERLDPPATWRQAPLFTPRERAALAWVEAVTLGADSHVPDDIYQAAQAEFSEQELVELTMAVVAVNGWNRPMVLFRIPPAIARNT